MEIRNLYENLRGLTRGKNKDFNSADHCRFYDHIKAQGNWKWYSLGDILHLAVSIIDIQLPDDAKAAHMKFTLQSSPLGKSSPIEPGHCLL